jgi:hypothetical protein
MLTLRVLNVERHSWLVVFFYLIIKRISIVVEGAVKYHVNDYAMSDRIASCFEDLEVVK